MPLKLELEKSAQKLKLSLEKKGVATPPVAELAFDLDVSGSFEDEHRRGRTQALLNRLVPWGMVFDPDKKLDVFTFSGGSEHAYHVGDVNADTVEGYVEDNIIGRVPGWNGGTDYSYVLEANLRNFGWMPSDRPIPAPRKTSFLGSFFGRKQEPQAAPAVATPRRSIVVLLTDGECGTEDKQRTRRVLRDSQNRGDQIYFLFIGVSSQPKKFDFLKDIGDEFGNTGLVVIEDLPAWVRLSDEEINEQLIGDELIEWLKK